MKRVIMEVGIATLILAFSPSLWAVYPGGAIVGVENQLGGTFEQQTSVIGGGNAYADSTSVSGAEATGGTGLGYSTSSVSINTTSISNYKNRTAPIGVVPPYLPLWNHGGWGTIKGYFANGPSSDETVYERTFDPADPEDMAELRRIIEAIPYSGPLEVLGGVLNEFAIAFGCPDRFHHGRGFEIASSIIRDRRPDRKPLLVFIDTKVDRAVLRNAGYAYVGKISIEAKETLNWDQAYNAAVVEALPWDVDILLISGGMKGVTVGSNLSFPGAAGGYSQTTYSLSLFGGLGRGITEGKGKPVMSAEAYRYNPRLAQKRMMPSQFYEALRARYSQVMPGQGEYTVPAQPAVPQAQTYNGNIQGVQVSRQLYEMAGFQAGQQMDLVAIRQP
ncbi:MAG: hypothetical protein QHH07_05325 [Sedimentisphaerales bacterium]|jgi:hypothetical protein|nr:hypothetical protein [Sedimentisphaerales bacterium]